MPYYWTVNNKQTQSLTNFYWDVVWTRHTIQSKKWNKNPFIFAIFKKKEPLNRYFLVLKVGAARPRKIFWKKPFLVWPNRFSKLCKILSVFSKLNCIDINCVFGYYLNICRVCGVILQFFIAIFMYSFRISFYVT